MTERIDAVVVGAGVVGLAVARALAVAGRETVVLESQASIGTGISSRSSEVIHAGIYYPNDSLKARLCVAGRGLLYRYCIDKQIAHRRLGKLIVAVSAAESTVLARYRRQAAANGVGDLTERTAREARALEPALQCAAALWSPSTGIVDTHGLMSSLQADLEAHGGQVVCNSVVSGGEARSDGVLLQIAGPQPYELLAGLAVNCAGLDAQQLSRGLRGIDARTIPRRHLAKGHYFSLSGPSPFRHLVYPLADSAGLGIHATLDLAGATRFGPDVQWVDHIDYGVDEQRRAQFAAAIRRYCPQLDETRLQPAYAGIRPKISGPGEAAADFCIRGPAEHGGLRYAALYGIESPGLTASLAIGEHVQRLFA